MKAKSKPGTKEAHGVEVMRQFRKATASALERNKIRLKETASASTSSSVKGKKADDDDDDDDDVGDDGDDDNGSITAGMTDEYGNLDDSCSDAGSYTDGHGVTGRMTHFRSMHPINTHPINAPPINTSYLSTRSPCQIPCKHIYNTLSTHLVNTTFSPIALEKPRLSIAERKKMKKRGISLSEMRKIAARKAATAKLVADCEELGDGSNSNRSNGGNKRKRAGGGLGLGVLEELEITGGVGSSFQDRYSDPTDTCYQYILHPLMRPLNPPSPQ